jgi:hypothetical protein
LVEGGVEGLLIQPPKLRHFYPASRVRGCRKSPPRAVTRPWLAASPTIVACPDRPRPRLPEGSPHSPWQDAGSAPARQRSFSSSKPREEAVSSRPRYPQSTKSFRARSHKERSIPASKARPPRLSCSLAGWTKAFGRRPPVSVRIWRFLPLTFFAPSFPRGPLFPWSARYGLVYSI